MTRPAATATRREIKDWLRSVAPDDFRITGGWEFRTVGPGPGDDVRSPRHRGLLVSFEVRRPDGSRGWANAFLPAGTTTELLVTFPQGPSKTP